MSTVAETLAAGLADADIDVVFGLPGGETVELLDAMRRRGLRFVLVHRECSAVFMASAAARLLGRPAACLTTLGPGATNAITGAAHAFLDRAPVVLITAQTPSRLLPLHTHQVVDLEALFAPVTKASVAVQPVGAAETVREAITLATAGRPGPVHLRVSNEDAPLPALPGPSATSPAGLTAQAEPGRVSAANLEKARQLIARSSRPVIVVGLGLEPERPYAELVGLAEALQAPVIVTPKIKGAISDEHPLSAGTIGLTPRDPVYELLQEADLVLAVGFDVVELVRPWSHPAPLVWIAAWSNLGPTLPAQAELVGPVGPVLARLATTSPLPPADWGASRVAEQRRRHPTLSRAHLGLEPLTPQAVLHVLREALPPAALLTTDVGSHKILACLEWPAYVPNRFLVSNGLSSMGYGLPAAVAAGIIEPNSPIVCLTGDAGLAMTLGELGTLSRAGGPVTVVVLKDHALDLIRSHQRRSGKPPFATEFEAPDFVRIAEAHRIQASHVADETALAHALKRVIKSSRPGLIEVAIDPRTYPTTTRGPAAP